MLRETGLLRRKRKKDEADPSSGAANLADVILVFMVGLMLSVIVFYGVNFETPEDSEDMYKPLGYIYVDPDTGKRYLIME